MESLFNRGKQGSRTFLSNDFGSKEKKQQKWNGMAWGFQFLINTSKRCSNCMRQRISNLSLGYKKALAGDYNFEARSVRRAVLRRLKSTVPSFLFFQGTLTSWKKCSVGASSKRYIVEDTSLIISPHLPVPFIFGTRGRSLPDILACLGVLGSKYKGNWKMRVGFVVRIYGCFWTFPGWIHGTCIFIFPFTIEINQM